jgi:hypothetical protein
MLRLFARDDPMSRLKSAAENSENAVMIASNTGRITYIVGPAKVRKRL